MNIKTVALTREQYQAIIQTMKQGFTGCRPNERVASMNLISCYQNLTPISGFSIQAVQAQYTIDTKQISLCITNHSDN